MFKKKMAATLLASTMAVGLLTAGSASAAQMSTIAKGTYTGTMYSAAKFTNGSVITGGTSGKYMIFDPTGQQIQYSNSWYFGTSGYIYAVAALSNGNAILVGTSGHWEIIDPLGNMVSQGTWPNGTAHAIHAVTALNNDNIMLAGDGGNFAILDNTGATVKFGHWGPYNTGNTYSIKAAIQLYNTNIMLASANGVYDILDSFGNEVRSGNFANVAACNALTHYFAPDNTERVLAGGNSGKFDVTDATGFGYAGGTLPFSIVHTETFLPSGAIFVGGYYGNYSLLDQAGTVQGTYKWYSGNYDIWGSVLLDNLNLFTIGGSHWEVLREY